METKTTLNGFTVSDLHLLAERSEGHVHQDHLVEKAGNADIVVLNGDIFDFKWTVLSDLHESVDAALIWLDELTGTAPNCHFYYVLGNHDSFTVFVDALSSFAAETPNLTLRQNYLKLGTNLFFHGDMQLRVKGHCPTRNRPQKDLFYRKGKLANWTYSKALDWRLQDCLPYVYTKRFCARKLLSTIANKDLLDGVTDIFFAHTHIPMTDFDYKGIRFHNTGCAVKGMDMMIIDFTHTIETREPSEV